jgi:sRNA-binding carbon storage regulator CsrA
MLVSGRKIGESIRINTVEGIVELSVCPVYGVQLIVGVDAQQQAKIVRSETDKRFDKQVKAA